MLIHEVCEKTHLTKKAIEYYLEQGLISPAILENGYRNFSKCDLNRLKGIADLRTLGLSVEEIRSVLGENSAAALREATLKKDRKIEEEQAKKDVLEELSCGKTLDDVAPALTVLRQKETITERLLESFPGYYGQFLCLHFSRFLNEPIQTDAQAAAYKKVLAFLDNASVLEFPQDVRKFLDESTKSFSADSLKVIDKNATASIEAPEQFLANNQKMLREYYTFLQSDEFRSSPLFKLKKLMREFNRTSGYNDIFLPAMRELSPSYAAYSEQLEKANEKFLNQYPDFPGSKE